MYTEPHLLFNNTTVVYMSTETNGNVEPNPVPSMQKNGITYLLDERGKRKQYKPWLGDLFSFAYDRIMARSVFPNKFDASLDAHPSILQDVLSGVHGMRVLELATGSSSGSAATMLPNDNDYTGVDISTRLLRKAVRRFERAAFYLCSADALHFAVNAFDRCICNLSLNFFPDLDIVLDHVRRVLKPYGQFVCSVPVPERNARRSTVRENLHTQRELAEQCAAHGFTFEPLPAKNGARLYFEATAVSS